MADFSQLSRLTRKADSVAESASALVRQTMREIRGELANLSAELNLAGSAADREKVYAEIRRRMALLSRRMNTLMEAQNEAAAKGAAKSAATLTGLEVKYSPSRAKAICELVTPAQGENIAAVFTDRMGRNLINSLREATVGMLREQAVAGGTMKDMSRDLAERWAKAAKVEDPKFTDAAGRTWDTKAYIQMNVRTNTMRVYNDCLADNVARETGGDLMRISMGGDPDCDCAAWEGCIISLTGKTKEFPTYEDARNGGCFHPNCTHTLEYVDETADAAEIELQKSVPAEADMAADFDAQDERKYQIDQARYMRDNPGMTQEEARIAVDRDNLAASIQSGLVRDDAKELVAKMTDAQVAALCPDGNPPAFEPAKGTKKRPEPEKWNHGKYGGVVHVKRNADLTHILEVAKVADAKPAEKPAAKPEPVKTPEEIRAMDIRDAIKASERLFEDLKAAPIPESITTRERRLERAQAAYKKRRKDSEAIEKEYKRIDKAYWRTSNYAKREELNRQRRELQKTLSRATSRRFRAYTLYSKINDRLLAEQLPWAIGLIAHKAENAAIRPGRISPKLPLWRDARQVLEKIVARSVFPEKPITVHKLKDYGRAFQRDDSINLSAQAKIPTFVHEAMHFIEEWNPHVHKRCVEFLRYRTRGEEPQSLKALTGKNFESWEMTRPDKFFDPYCGKQYERMREGVTEVTATEVLSMGVERLTKNPVKFLREDPEYATMCLALIRGGL